MTFFRETIKQIRKAKSWEDKRRIIFDHLDQLDRIFKFDNEAIKELSELFSDIGSIELFLSRSIDGNDPQGQAKRILRMISRIEGKKSELMRLCSVEYGSVHELLE